MATSGKKDYYQILEVDKSASGEDIKKAYRRLALKWHPDKNPDNVEEAKKKFQDIAEAYSVLSDKNKRQQYDLGETEDFSDHFSGPSGFSHFGSGGGFSFAAADEMFRDFFNGVDKFSTFDGDDFIGGGFFGGGKKSKKRGAAGAHQENRQGGPFAGIFGDPFFGGNEPFGNFGFSNHGFDSHQGFSSEMFESTSSGPSMSTKTYTVMQNGKTVTKTEKTTIGRDGKKTVEIIEESKDRDGNVQRKVQSLENPSDKPKSIKGKDEPKKSRHKPEYADVEGEQAEEEEKEDRKHDAKRAKEAVKKTKKATEMKGGKSK